MLNNVNLNEYERLEAVKREAEKMEQHARQQEKLIKLAKVKGYANDSKDNVQRMIDVNDSYIDAITAKLKILDQI